MNRSSLMQACFGGVLLVALVRASVLYEPLPGWDGTPLTTVSAIVGLGPAGLLALDTAAVLLTALLCAVAGKRLGWVAFAAQLGGLAVIAHTMLFAAGDAQPLAIAGAWASGGALLAAGSVAASRPALRRVGIAVVTGFLCILLAKGAAQWFVEHPSVIERFDQDPVGSLATRGYEPGSPSALQFERRLRQPDITGWFGLSNVLAAYLAAGAVGCLALCWHARSNARLWPWWTTASLGLLCWLGVAATGSKAGLVIAAAGSGVFLAVQTVTKAFGRRTASRKIARAMGLAVWVLPVAAIAARPLVMPLHGELSVLFRYFYLDAAVDIARSNLLVGTGIDGFRAAYAIAKPPIAPESVTSSHNAIADWLTMLGLFGLPLAAAAIAAAWQISGSLRGSGRTLTVAPLRRPTLLSIALMLSVPVVASAALESAATLIELALLRLAGLLLAVAAAAAVWRLRPTRVVPAAFALVLLTHAQLDMVMFHPGSIPLAMLAIGLAVPSRRGMPWKGTSAVIPTICSAALVVLCVRAWQWEAPLRRAFEAAQAIAATTERAEMGSASARAELPIIVREQVPLIRADLRSAAEAMPSDARAWLALCDVDLMVTGPGPAAWTSALAAADAEHSTRTLSRVASVAAAIAQTPSAAPDRDQWVDLARQALTRAAELDPHGPHFPGLVAELEAAEGRDAPARVWAARALQSDANYDLDPLARLPDDRRRRLEELVKDSLPGS